MASVESFYRSRPPIQVTDDYGPVALDVKSVKATDTVRVGGTLTMTVVIANTGQAANTTTEFQFSELADYADLGGCKPKCTVSSGFGDLYAVVPGVKAGAEQTIKIRFIPTKVGVVRWTVCIYDDEMFGDVLGCWEGTTKIR